MPLVIIVLFAIAAAAAAVAVAGELMGRDWDRGTLIAVAVVGVLMLEGGLAGLRGVSPHRTRAPETWVRWFASLVLVALVLGHSLWDVSVGTLLVTCGFAALAYGFGWAFGGVLRAIGSMIQAAGSGRGAG